MSLADFQPATDVVSFRGKPLITVRGLSLDDIAILMRENLSDLDELIKLYAEGVDENVAVAKSAQFIVAMAREMPALVARIICLSCDEPTAEDKARKLPLPVQVDALQKIVTLTFSEAGGAKKFFESLKHLILTVRPVSDQPDSII